MSPGQIQFILYHLNGLLDRVDLKDEPLHGQISTQVHVWSTLTILQTGLGQFQRILLGLEGPLQLPDRIFLLLNLLLSLENIVV